MSKFTKAQLEVQLAESEKKYGDLLALHEEGLGGPDDIPEHGHSKRENKVQRQARLKARTKK